MALIKCPECGGQVSDKAPACIHCGYPLQNKVNDVWNGRDVSKINEFLNNLNGDDLHLFVMFCEYIDDLSKPGSDPTKRNLKNQVPNPQYSKFYEFMGELAFNYNLTNHNTGKFLLEYLRSKNYASPAPVPVQTTTASQNVVRCPRCGSTSVTTEEQGYGFFGWIGASQKKNLCQKCGHKWWPGR